MSDTPQPPESDPMTIDPSNLGSVDPLSVEGIFLVALGKSGADRQEFLTAQCADEEQRQRVDALLAAYEQAGSFLDKPVIAAEPVPVVEYLAPCSAPGVLGKLGPYEIIEEIGRGGMGVVFRAHDPKLQRIVAVKALAPELARLPVARQRFLREARAAAAISHPHVVTIFAVDGTEEASLGTERTTLPYLVMECIVGQTLHDKIKRVGALKTEEIVRISRQIAEGLAAAHKRGLIHRDIKPANILLENGVERVKITDFGLARTTSDGGITHTGEILGTPQCMSPEQARGELVDQRSDLFSMGCVMYTMCTGVNPFRADNMLAVMKKVCEDTPKPIKQLNPEMPEWLCALVEKLLQKDPSQRVQSAGEVVEVLEARAVASGSRGATSPTQEGQESIRQDPGNVPQWLLTPIIPGLEQWLFRDHLLPVTLIAMVIGFFFGEDKENIILALPVVGVVGFGLLALVMVWRKAQWNWINWKTMISVPLGLFLGGVSRAWLIHKNRSGTGVMEELARNNAGWFIFPLAIAIFWLLNRYFRDLFHRNPQSASEAPAPPQKPLHWSTWTIIGLTVLTVLTLAFGGSRHALRPNRVEMLLVVYVVALNIWLFVHLVAWGVKLAGRRDQPTSRIPTSAAPAVLDHPQSRSPWSILGWLLVSILGVVTLGIVLLAVGIMVPYFASRTAPIGPGQQVTPAQAYVQIQSSLNETVTGVTIDGTPAFVTQINAGMWQLKTSPGEHTFVVSFTSPDPAKWERVFETKIHASINGITIEAIPVNRPIATQPSLPERPVPGVTMFEMDQAGSDGSRKPLESTSIPLGDAVEMLNDLESGPRYPYLQNSFMTAPRTQVWIDEPGLTLRLRPLDFDGDVKASYEYSPISPWGVGCFQYAGDVTQNIVELPPGRYRVLVHDLDYGWDLERRGTIVIGQGQQTIHVKRSFSGQQLPPVAAGASFRWAGLTYQIKNAAQMNAVNQMLAKLAREQTEVSRGVFTYPEVDFTGHPLAEQLNQLQPGPERQLSYARRVMRVEIPADLNIKWVGIFSPHQGLISWTRSSSREFHVPFGTLNYMVSYQRGFSWPGSGSQIDLVPESLPKQTLTVGKMTKAMMRTIIEAYRSEAGQNGSYLGWFEEQPVSLPKHGVKAAERLVLAWLDGQPEVPETELLQIGGVESWEKLWENGQSGQPQQNMKYLLLPGQAPGTWRLKEPPEGTVAP